MKREQQTDNQALNTGKRDNRALQPGAIVDRANHAAQAMSYSGCDKKHCGKTCKQARTCESLAGLLFNFRMTWGA